ncbi:MAG: HIT family protein [Candidatus Pacearchaeota archaeon]|nr:HIT family protein [Candidatus Pacearchaeota archaeon]
MIPKEQEAQIKKQLFQQIDNTFPEDQKIQAKTQLETMTGDTFEEFLKQNNLIKSSEETNNSQCVFCSIVFGDIPSTKIGENSKAIAVLELNPISHAHSIIIPKEHVSKEEDISDEVRLLAKEIAEKINQTFNPKDITFFNTNIFGHEIINVLPIYTNETKDSPKQQSNPEELKQIADQLSNQIKPQTTQIIQQEKKEPQEEINEKNTWLPKRFP